MTNWQYLRVQHQNNSGKTLVYYFKHSQRKTMQQVTQFLGKFFNGAAYQAARITPEHAQDLKDDGVLIKTIK